MNVQALRLEMKTQIDIDAPPESVGSVLTAFKAYCEWNPASVAVSGDVSVGSGLTLRFQPPGTRGCTFRPKLLVVDRLRELRWTGWPRMPFVFETEHLFRNRPARRAQVPAAARSAGVRPRGAASGQQDQPDHEGALRGHEPRFEATNRASALRR
jgi:hypothetical protein